MLSGNRSRTLHDAFELLFKVCKTLVTGIEESTHSVSDITQTLTLFFQGIVGRNFCIVLCRLFFKLMLQGPNFIRSNRGKSCICGLFQSLNHEPHSAFHLGNDFILRNTQRPQLFDFFMKSVLLFLGQGRSLGIELLSSIIQQSIKVNNTCFRLFQLLFGFVKALNLRGNLVFALSEIEFQDS